MSSPALSSSVERDLEDGRPTDSDRPSKRMRMSTADDEDSMDEQSVGARSKACQPLTDAQQGAILPDSYLRSPRQAINPQHQPGSIVRVKLHNFVTYEHAEFHPGPNLNMVIGPNGTGKSTLVSAICLGLGWPTKHLGRAKDVADFVKHGHNKGTIEIELQRDTKRQTGNPVVTTVIKKQSNNCEFHINGKKCSMKEVQRLGRSYSIQVDNLCQFLPQDRVVEFATLTPVALLAQTQRAAAPEEVSEWHEELKTLDKETKAKDEELAALQESLKRLEGRQRAQQADVDRVKEHANLQQRLSLLAKALPFPQYQKKRAEYRDARQAERQAQRQLARIQAQLQPNMQAVDDKAHYLGDVVHALTSKKNVQGRYQQVVERSQVDYEAKLGDIELAKSEFAKQREDVKAAHQACQKTRRDIQSLKEQMRNVPPEVDFAAMNAEIRDLTRQIRTVEDQRRALDESVHQRKQQIRQHERKIEEEEQAQERRESQMGRQASQLTRLSEDSAKVLEWLEKNQHRFADKVYLPPVLTCEVTDQRCTAMLELAMGRNDLIAFTTTSIADHDLLTKHARLDMRLTDFYVRVVDHNMSRAPRPMSDEDLRRHGLEGYLVDIIRGPEAVVNMMCDGRAIDTTAYTTQQLTAAQNVRLRDSPVTNWVSRTEMSSVLRRREYGDDAVSVRVNQVRAIKFFTDSPVDQDAVRAFHRKINELKDEKQVLNESLKKESEEAKAVQEQAQDLQKQKGELENRKSELQRERTRFDALPTRLEGEEDKLANFEAKVSAFRAQRLSHEQDVDKLFLAKGQLALELVSKLDSLRKLHEEVLLLELMEIEAQSDLDQLKERNEDSQQQLDRYAREAQELSKVKERVKAEGEALGAQCRAAREELSSDPDIEAAFTEMIELSTDELENEIESSKARLEANTGGNANVVVEFEERAVQIERKKKQAEDINASRDRLLSQVADVRSKWEPELESTVSKISSAFAENFAAIQCAGEVELYKDDDFEQWAIHIKVKFRESEPLSLLDSHRQSGGERAVSTIFYLMAMQSLARAPFRVVDEINQGMDPRNERLVHSRLVQIACQPAREDGAGGSQYFLITPKLLTGLDYHPNMKVHCIASGEHMPGIHSSLDFGQLARKALAIRAG